MASPLYLSRFRVVAGAWTMDATIDAVNVNNIAIAAGTYYLDSPTASESLCAAIDAALEAAFAGEDFTVTYSTTTGKITIACTTLAGVWSLSFDQQAFADAIGWGSTLGFGPVAGASQVAPEVAQYAIFAGSGRALWSGMESEIPNAAGKSSAGVTSGVGSENESFAGSWLHGFERQVAVASPLESGTKDDAGTVRPWVWADFFKHHRTYRHPFRLYTAAGDAIGSYEDTLVLRDKSLGPFAPQPLEEGSWYFWQVPLEVDRYIAP